VAYRLSGLIIEGANWKDDHLAVNEGEAVVVGRSQVRWVHTESQNEATNSSVVNLPVYLNGDRSDVLFTVNLPFASSDASLSIVRAVCLTAGGASLV